MNENIKALKSVMNGHEVDNQTAQRSKKNMIERNMEPVQQRFNDDSAAVAKAASEAWDKKISDSSSAYYAARDAYEAALIAERTENTGWLPVGTEVWNWAAARGLYRYSRTESHYVPGRKAVVSVWTRKSESRENHRHAHLPQPGDVYLRILKKDGTASKDWERTQSWGTAGVADSVKECWLPEGVKHPRAKKEEA
jgi:hypothetical protein